MLCLTSSTFFHRLFPSPSQSSMNFYGIGKKRREFLSVKHNLFWFNSLVIFNMSQSIEQQTCERDCHNRDSKKCYIVKVFRSHSDDFRRVKQEHWAVLFRSKIYMSNRWWMALKEKSSSSFLWCKSKSFVAEWDLKTWLRLESALKLWISVSSFLVNRKWEENRAKAEKKWWNVTWMFSE